MELLNEVLMQTALVAEAITASYPRLIKIMYCRVRNRDLASDLINEASVIALEHTRAGRQISAEQLPGYVLSIAMNVLRNQRRDPDNRRELRVTADAALNELPWQDDDAFDIERMKQSVRAVVAALTTARDREVIKRFYLDEETKEVICSELNLSALQFDKVIFRARQRMKALFVTLGLHEGQFFTWLPAVAEPQPSGSHSCGPKMLASMDSTPAR